MTREEGWRPVLFAGFSVGQNSTAFNFQKGDIGSRIEED